MATYILLDYVKCQKCGATILEGSECDICNQVKCCYCGKKIYIDNILCRECDDKIGSVIESRKLEWLAHFTNVENLESIFKYGLLSRCILDGKQIEYKDNDKFRYDHREDCVCCSITFPNGKMLYNGKQLGNTYAIVIIDINIFYRQKFFCCQFNAAKDHGVHIKNGCELEIVFSGERSSQLKSFFATDVQAEILIKDRIDVNFIKAVIFENQYDLEKWKSKIPSNIQLEVNENFFEKYYYMGWD